MSGRSQSILAFLLFAVGGAFIAKNSWDGKTYFIPPKNPRDPAAIARNYNLSELRGKAVAVVSKESIFTASKLQKSSDGVGIELGHFVSKSKDGHTDFACSIYDTVELVFRAKGVAISGEIPEMKVKTKCTVGEAGERLAMVWLPLDKVFGSGGIKTQFEFVDEENVQVNFKGLTDFYPESWVLHEVQFQNQVTNEKLKVLNKKERDKLSFLWTPGSYTNPVKEIGN